jgi:hypothetical protein
MEQLSFSHKPDEKLFFLGSLAGLAKIGAAKAAGRASISGAKKMISSKPLVKPNLNIPIKISTGDINIGNKQQEKQNYE